MNMEYIVYKITNKINEKVYYGYTSQTLNERLWQHSKNTRKCIIRDSIRKYGVDNFIIESLYEFDNIHEAHTTEIYLIALHRTNICRYPDGNGMNMTDGGEGRVRGFITSEETKKKLSEANSGDKNGFFGKKHKKSSKKAMSVIKSTMYIGEGNPNYGKQHSKETKEKIGVKSKLRSQGENNSNYGNRGNKNPLSKKIIQIDAKTRNEIAIYFCAEDVGETINSNPNMIRRVCTGGRKTHKGYIWRNM